MGMLSSEETMTNTLSPRQLQIAELLQQGKKTQEIADIVGIKPRSVKSYLFLAYKKTGTHSVRELAQKISADGLDSFKASQIPKSTPDRRKLMTRIRWRDGDNCCLCGSIIDFRLTNTSDPMHPSFSYASTKSNEASIQLAHNQCNPLVGGTRDTHGEDSETVVENKERMNPDAS